MPYPRDSYPFHRPYICDGAHSSRTVKQEGALEVEICNDPTCAKVFATCVHEKNSWSHEGRLLTCDFCGIDGT